MGEFFFFVFLFVFAILGLMTLAKGARIVKQYERGLVTRLGKYHSITGSGLAFIVPWVDDLIRVDMRERVINVAPQKVITKDNVTVEVDAVVYYKVTDPAKSQFEVQNFDYACATCSTKPPTPGGSKSRASKSRRSTRRATSPRPCRAR